MGVQTRFLEVKIRINLKEGTKVPRMKNDLSRGKTNKIKKHEIIGSVGAMDWGFSAII